MALMYKELKLIYIIFWRELHYYLGRKLNKTNFSLQSILQNRLKVAMIIG